MGEQTSNGKGDRARPCNKAKYDASPYWKQVEELKELEEESEVEE